MAKSSGCSITTADLHLTSRPQDEYRWLFLDWLLNEVDQRRAARLFILGDLTDEKDRHDAQLLNRFVGWLSKVVDVGCKVYILEGNHDYIDPATPFFKFLGHIPDVKFVTEPTTMPLDGEEVAFVPHGTDWRGLEIPKCDLLLTHVTFEGAMVAGGKQALHGTATQAHVAKAGRVISGDVHWPQRVGKVVYVGAPYPIMFGDDFTPRVIYEVDGMSEDITPPHIRKWLIDTDPKNGLRSIKKPTRQTGGTPDQVRVRIHLTRRDFDRWSEIKQEILQQAEERGLEVYGVEMLSADETGTLQATGRAARRVESPVELFQRYCEELAVPKDDVKTGLGVLKVAAGEEYFA